MAFKRARYTGPSREVVAIVAARSAGWCEFPGCEHRAQDVHHRYERGMGGHSERLTWINEPPNLLAACRHHNYWCSNVTPEEARQMGWRVRRGDMPWQVPVQTRHDPLPVYLANDGTFSLFADNPPEVQ